MWPGGDATWGASVRRRPGLVCLDSKKRGAAGLAWSEPAAELAFEWHARATAAASAGRNETQGTTRLGKFVLGEWLLVIDFGLDTHSRDGEPARSQEMLLGFLLQT